MKRYEHRGQVSELLQGSRTSFLEYVGQSRLAQAIVAVWCGWFGVRVTSKSDGLLLTREGQTIRLLPKHLPFALGIARRFHDYYSARPLNGDALVSFVDYCSPGHLLTIQRAMRAGVTVKYAEGVFRLKKDKRLMLLQQKHFIYVADMAEKFDLYFSPVVPTEQDGLLVVNYSRPGLLQTYRNSGLQFEMASFPEEEEAIAEYFRWYRPVPGDTVFDMGAHCGISTCFLASMVGPQGRVVAFEPDPLNYGLLLRNLERHGHANVTALNIAVSSSTGTAAFNCEGTIGSGLVSLLERDSVGSTVNVETVTMAEAFERWGRPAFCKIDIEGAELEVLASSKEVLMAHKIHLALDTNHFVDGVLTSAEVERMLRSYGYETASESNPLATTWARPK